MERSDILRNILDNLSSQISSHTNPNNITNALKSVKNEKLYNELISHGYSVDVGVVVDRRKGGNAQKEIDFVVNRGDKRIYIQSAWQMNTDEKINAELDSLKLAKDFFSKIIVQNDIPETFRDTDGILHVNLIEFLLNPDILQ